MEHIENQIAAGMRFLSGATSSVNAVDAGVRRFHPLTRPAPQPPTLSAELRTLAQHTAVALDKAERVGNDKAATILRKMYAAVDAMAGLETVAEELETGI